MDLDEMDQYLEQTHFAWQFTHTPTPKDFSCDICHEEIHTPTTTTTLPCSHEFCTPCLFDFTLQRTRVMQLLPTCLKCRRRYDEIVILDSIPTGTLSLNFRQGLWSFVNPCQFRNIPSTELPSAVQSIMTKQPGVFPDVVLLRAEFSKNLQNKIGGNLSHHDDMYWTDAHIDDICIYLVTLGIHTNRGPL